MRDVVLAVDVGGTRTKISYQGRDGATVARETVPTVLQPDPADTATGVVETIARAVLTAPADTAVRGVGLSVPGTVDEIAGIAISSGNLRWTNVPFAESIRTATGLPAVLSQDLRAGGRAESATGAARGYSSALFVPIGTGIGAAILLNGEIWTGPHLRAGELGHLAVETPGVQCGCGRSGCLETVASASALRRRYLAATGDDVDAAVIASRVDAGEPAAVAEWSALVEALARALDWTDTILDLDVMVIGGGLALSGDTLLAPLRAELQRLNGRDVPVLASVHGDWAGSVGAGIRAWERVG